jgi:hypothetical protein
MDDSHITYDPILESSHERLRGTSHPHDEVLETDTGLNHETIRLLSSIVALSLVSPETEISITTRDDIPPDLQDVPVTLRKEQYEMLMRKKYKDVIQLYMSRHGGEVPYHMCPITHEPLTDNTTVIMLDCGHLFSEIGMRRWLLEESTKCPICKADVRENLK